MIHTLFFLIVVAITTTIGGSVVVLVGMFRKYSPFLLKYIIKPWARLQLLITGTKVVVQGLEHIDPKQSYIIVSNHQSHMDIPVLIVILPLRFTIIAKKELFRIPIFAQQSRPRHRHFKARRGNRPHGECFHTGFSGRHPHRRRQPTTVQKGTVFAGTGLRIADFADYH